jgi:hypothetical protein
MANDGPRIEAGMSGRRSKRSAWWVGGLAALFVVTAVAGLVVARGGDSGPATPVTFEPADEPGPDLFTATVQVGSAVELTGAARAATERARPRLPLDAGSGTRLAEGSMPGLYGGSGDARVCDPSRLVAYLEADPAKAAAWASVFGLRPERVRGFVASLAPVVLTADTLVTNHGYRDGHVTTLQSVLEAGTAVMIDPAGVPRVKCNCGNPLTEPSPVDVAHVGRAPWPGYDPSEVVVVRPGRVSGSHTLVDVTSGDAFEQPAVAGPVAPDTNISPSPTTPGSGAGVRPCPRIDERTGAPNPNAATPPVTFTLPGGVRLPSGGAIFAAGPDDVLVAPSGFRCTAALGDSDAHRLTVADPRHPTHFLRSTGGGAIDAVTPGCGYFAAQRAWAAQNGMGDACPVPPSGVDHAELPTGSPETVAAIVAVPAGVVAPSVSGDPDAMWPDGKAPEIAAVVLFVGTRQRSGPMYVASGRSVTCVLPRAQASMCTASLLLQLEQLSVSDKAGARVALQRFLSAHS